MPDPLPADVVARLKSDPTAALAAALILAGSFPDLVSWAMRVFGGEAKTGDRQRRAERRTAPGGSNGVAKERRGKEGRSRQGPP